jgi:hypothetical protein
VAAGAGDFEGALGSLLAAHIFEVDRVVLGFVQQRVAIYLQGRIPFPVFTKRIASSYDFTG